MKHASVRLCSTRKVPASAAELHADIVSQYGMEQGRSKAVPLNPGEVLIREGEKCTQPYSALVGSLNYLALCTRPDLAQAVGVLARYMSAPTEAHWGVALGVVRYLRGTQDLGLVYSRSGQGVVVGFCDADFAGDRDQRRSTTGYVFLAAGGAISWSSQRQKTVALSTAEAEYQAASAAAREALWMRQLMQDLAVPLYCISIRSDNQAALTLLANPVLSQRSKHIDVIHHFARERAERGEVGFNYIPTAEMAADFLTKSVPESTFQRCRVAVGMRNGG